MQCPIGQDGPVKVHLIDGTYELFRQHFGQAARHSSPAPSAATVGVVSSTLQLVADGATHIGVASDHVVESFRNDWWAGYKTSEGMPPELLEQIPMMEEALAAAGFTVWPMVDHEADDALGAAAAVADADERAGEVLAEALRSILKAIDRDEIIEDFVDSNALAFAERSIDAEQRLEWAPLYNKYVELVELVIKDRLDELDCSAEDLFKYARRYSDEDPGARRLLRKVHALEEYREF